MNMAFDIPSIRIGARKYSRGERLDNEINIYGSFRQSFFLKYGCTVSGACKSSWRGTAQRVFSPAVRDHTGKI